MFYLQIIPKVFERKKNSFSGPKQLFILVVMAVREEKERIHSALVCVCLRVCVFQKLLP